MQDNEKKPALRFKGFTDPWEQRKLGELSRSFEYGLNAAAKEYDGQNKYLRITDIDDTSRQFVSADITSPDANLAEADNYRLSDGDVLFARTGASVGKTYLYKKSDGLVYFAGFLIRAKIKESVSAGFIFQNTLTRSYERYIAITSQRSGQPGVNAQEYAEYQLMLPELFEQEKIAKLLEALDILITLHQRKYEKLVNIKKSMLNKMFPPNGASVPEIRFKDFTDPWEQRKLEEYLEVSGQKNFEGIYTKEDVLSVSGDFGIVNQIEFQGRSFAGASVANYGVVETGDIVYTKSPLKSNPYGIIKANKGKNGIVSTLYAVYKPKQSANPEFVQIYFEQDARMNNYMHPLVNKGAKNDMKVSAENALKGQIVFPDIKEQRTISEFFRNLDTLITLHQREHIKPILEVKRVKRNE